MSFAFIPFALLTAPILVLLIITWSKERAFARQAVVVLGEIIDYREDEHDAVPMFAPIYRYEYQGQVYHGESRRSTSRPSYPIGTLMEIYIHPDTPHKSRLKHQAVPGQAIIMDGVVQNANSQYIVTESPLIVLRWLLLIVFVVMLLITLIWYGVA